MVQSPEANQFGISHVGRFQARGGISAVSQLVVVLDEDDAVFDAVAKPLEDAGYLVLPLSTADGIADELKATQAAALLLDLQLGPSTAGLDVLTQLEGDAELRCMPILVYSADAGQLLELSPRLLARGYGVLQKPFDIDEVLHWLHKHEG